MRVTTEVEATAGKRRTSRDQRRDSDRGIDQRRRHGDRVSLLVQGGGQDGGRETESPPGQSVP